MIYHAANTISDYEGTLGARLQTNNHQIDKLIRDLVNNQVMCC